MGYDYSQETFAVFDECAALVAMNLQEAGLIEGTVSQAIYRNLEKAGALRVFIARMGGEVVAYSTMICGDHPHYGKRVAHQDALFVHPSHRGSGVWARLVKMADKKLKKEGIAIVLRQVRGHECRPMALHHLGYEKVETVYANKLQGG
jgi:GNAT superfamily N-acetyltransferase